MRFLGELTANNLLQSHVFTVTELPNVDNVMSIFELAAMNSKYFDQQCASDSFTHSYNPDSFDSRFSDQTMAHCLNYYDYGDLETLFTNCKFDFKLLCHNIRSVGRNFEELHNDVSDLSFSVIALSETRLSDDKMHMHMRKQNFDGIFNNRDCNGGGVGFYIANHLTYNRIDEISFMEPEIECICIKLKYPCADNIVVNIYKPPGANSSIFLE